MNSSQAAGSAYVVPQQYKAAPGPTNATRIEMLTTIVRMFRAWKRYNQSLAELSRLGDRELSDIGISRSDIQRIAWNAAHQR
jgi:uncharacterized protein YjiS (DUF1127 family)